MAASANFALKAGAWFRRGRLLIVSPDSLGTACPLSGRNSTYRPVQISGTSSDFHATAGGPADIGVGGRAGRLHRLDVAVGDAASDIGQPAIERIADPCARGADPALLGLTLAAAVGGTDATH